MVLMGTWFQDLSCVSFPTHISRKIPSTSTHALPLRSLQPRRQIAIHLHRSSDILHRAIASSAAAQLDSLSQWRFLERVVTRLLASSGRQRQPRRIPEEQLADVQLGRDFGEGGGHEVVESFVELCWDGAFGDHAEFDFAAGALGGVGAGVGFHDAFLGVCNKVVDRVELVG